LRYFLSEPNKIHDYCAASGLYNAMIHPLINFRIKGAIWYQGESNRQQADLYTKLFPTMIGNWRDAWGQGDFPFYFVQIAPFDYGENEDASGYLREAQTRTLSVPNTGMAVTMDIGNLHNIHPADKQDVGLRLALLALNRTYGMKNAACEGPEFGSAIIDGNQIRVIFNKAKDGLIVKGEYPTCFRLAGRDMVFHPAMARIDGNSVIVSSEIVSAPLFIRYAFADLDSVNLFNKAGLPAVPFRTDSVSIFIRAVSIDIKTDSSSGERRFSLSCPDSRCQVRYTLDGSEPDIKSGLFSNPVALSQSATISARAFRGEMASSLIRKAIYCKHAAIDKPVILANPPSNLYPGGRNALVDGIRGSANYFHAAWQGYSGVDFEATIDLGDTIGIENIRAGFLLNSGSWIFLPVQVTFSISTDGVNYTKLSDFQTTDNQQTKNVYVKDYKWELAGAATDDKALNRKPFPVARYVRVFAKNTGKCPKWHPGKGDKAWLFVDELVVNEQ
jgi:hypothetical protein